MVTFRAKADDWLQTHAGLAAVFITLLGFLARLWTASGTFLNSDEALHFRLANQVSLALAYQASLTSAHPPLLILLLYFWRALGTSELWLRLPSVLAGVVFCWMFYKWLIRAAGPLPAFIGLFFVAFLPPIIALAAEVRQYSLLLAFLAGALYFLDEAFARNSPARIAAFTLCLCLAMLSHYSSLLFAAALGLYALFRIFTERPPIRLVATWVIGQLVALALALFLYKTHLSKLGAGESRTVLQGWMSEFYLHHSYFDPAHDNPLLFLVTHTFGVFQFFFGQLAVGALMGLFFLVAVALLLRGKTLARGQTSPRRLGLFLLLPFAIAGCASLAHVYPYGGTRHVAFLTIPGVAGVSLALARLAAERWARALALAACIIAASFIFGKPHRPRMDRADQSQTHMSAAMEFLKQNHDAPTLIFTDYQSDLILGHYLCHQQPISFETFTPDFEAFSCGRRVVSASFRTATHFTPPVFITLWRDLVDTYRLKPGDTVLVFQAGWESDLPEDLRTHVAEFHDLQLQSFGNNIKIFKMTVAQPMSAAAP
jgi:hypothetical protein